MRDLRHFIRIYDENLAPELCRRLIETFVSLASSQKRNGAGVRKGLENSAWTEVNVTRLSEPEFMRKFEDVFTRAIERYNTDVGLPIAVPNSGRFADLILKQYVSGADERFQLHFDAIHGYSNRYLVLLWYLNDVQSGGATRFPTLDLEVAPKAGRLLMFPPYWMYQHEGLPPLSNDKYILSTYCLFSAEDSANLRVVTPAI